MGRAAVPLSEGGHTLKPFDPLPNRVMSDETLQTSGDHYYDEAEDPGFVAVATRNVGKAKSAITSGEAGATAVATAIGFAVAAFVTGGIGD